MSSNLSCAKRIPRGGLASLGGGDELKVLLVQRRRALADRGHIGLSLVTHIFMK